MVDQPNRLSPEERYRRDPWFNRLVDTLVMHLATNHLDEAQADVTPTELREAAILACTIFEMRHPRPVVVAVPPDPDPRLVRNLRWP